MIELQTFPKFKLAAIDLDGTLLGPDATISAANREAVKRLQRAGLHVVLASGRHFKSMLRYAEALPGIEWLVSSQGGEVTDLRRTVVLSPDFLPHARVAELFRLGRSLGFSPIAFGADGVFTSASQNADLEFYTELDGHPPMQCELEQILQHKIFKVIWVGNPQAVEQNWRQCPVDQAGIQVVRTDARFLEFMPVAMTKASALESLVRRLGIQASEAIAFGDADNDVPMFKWAGLSMAMPHGWPAAIRSASYVAAPGPAETALARGVDFLFAHGFLSVPTESAVTPPIVATAGLEKA
jgi:Cof subfamily protein (haloacid dehalogenase superfamily)